MPQARELSSRLAAVLFLFAYTGLSAGPVPGDERSGDQIRLAQASGGTLVLPNPANKLVTLSPHLAELVFAAGAGEYLQATVAFSDYPPEVATLPLVGDAFRIDAERIHLISPDLVLAWQSGNPAPAISQLSELGLNVWSIEITEPREIARVLDDIGRATGKSGPAGKAAQDVLRRIERLESGYTDARAIPYFYQVAASPLFTITGEHLISRSLALCGGENVFGKLGGLAPQVSAESVLLSNPLLMIAPDVDGSDPLAHWMSWPRLRAVEQGNLLLLPAD